MTETTGPTSASPLIERMRRALYQIATTGPALFIAPIALALFVALLSREHSPERWAFIVALAAASIGWSVVWHRALGIYHAAPAGRRLGWLIPLTLTGGVLLGAAAYAEIVLVIAMIPLLPRSFLTLPFWLAYPFLLMFVLPADAALIEELSRPARVAPTILVVLHVCAIAILGIFLQSIAAQFRDREALLRSLAGSERRTGQLEERHRLAGEIHDTLAQGFAAIVTHLEAGALSRGDGAVGWDHVASAKQVARDSLEEARRMMAALHPEALERADLPEALRRTANAWARRTGIACTVEVTGDPTPLHRDIEVALLRATQEALANAWRHAQASRVTVTLSWIGDVIALDVQDDGIGGASLDLPGFGLNAMRTRLAQVNGTVMLESSVGDGTTLTVTLPIERSSST